MIALSGAHEPTGVAQLALLPQADEHEQVSSSSKLPVTEQEHEGVAQVGLSAVQLLDVAQEPVDPVWALFSVPLRARMKPSPSGQVLVLVAVQLALKVVEPGSQFGGLHAQLFVSASHR